MKNSVCKTLMAIALLLPLTTIAAPIAAHANPEASVPGHNKTLKRKVAVARFTNETIYGKSLLRDSNDDPLGKQASDILVTYLTQSDKFLVFERYDLNKVEKEQILSGSGSDIIGVDTLIMGSVIEFGRATDGQRGLFNRDKVQRAHAKVALRLVDVKTGHVYHSATGAGEATTESGTVLGLGSTAKYDATLSDKAISAAVEDVIESLINSLSGRAWRTDILKAEGSTVYITGGKSQGLAVGDQLAVMKAGETIKSGQSGFPITLPATKIAEIQVQALFGETEMTEGAVATIIGGGLPQDLSDVYVTSQ